MTFRVLLETKEGNVTAAIRSVLRALLESGRVDALLAPCRPAEGAAVVPAVVTAPQQVDICDPLAPVMPVNMATLAARLAAPGAGRRIGAVLRPCEWRAAVELIKLHQIDPERFVAIGIDCLGTYDAAEYAEMRRAGLEPHALWAGAPAGDAAPIGGHSVRSACQMCEHPTAAGAHLHIGLIGLDYPRQLLVESVEELPLEGSPASEATLGARAQAIADLTARRTAARDRILAAWRGRLGDVSQLLAEFAGCVGCQNCMVACPICYCKECIFRTPTFDHEPEQYVHWAERRGALRLPTDTLLFHLTRLNHMATSCVGCGACESACPNHLPVATLFRAVAQRVQAQFDYEAGRSIDEELPLATFREDELPQV